MEWSDRHPCLENLCLVSMVRIVACVASCAFIEAAAWSLSHVCFRGASGLLGFRQNFFVWEYFDNIL